MINTDYYPKTKLEPLYINRLPSDLIIKIFSYVQYDFTQPVKHFADMRYQSFGWNSKDFCSVLENICEIWFKHVLLDSFAQNKNEMIKTFEYIYVRVGAKNTFGCNYFVNACENLARNNFSLLGNEIIALHAIKYSPKLFTSIPKKLREKESFQRLAIESHCAILEYLPDNLREEEPLIFKAIKSDPGALCFTTLARRNDPDFIANAIQINRRCFPYAGKELQADRDYVMKLIEIEPCIYQELNSTFRCDRAIALKAVQGNPFLLSDLPKDLQEDKEIASYYTQDPCL